VRRETQSVRRVAVSSSSQILSLIITSLIGLLVIRILATHLGPYGYGEYIILITLVNITILIVNLGLNTFIYRELALNPTDAGTIIGSNLSLRLAISVPGAFAVIGLGLILYGRHYSLTPALYIAALDVPLTMTQDTVTAYYGARVRGEVQATIALIGKILFISSVAIYFGYFLVSRQSSSNSAVLFVVMACYVGADASTALASIALVHRRIQIRPSLHWRVWWNVLSRSARLSIIQLINSIYIYLDGLLLSVISNARQVAYYGLAFNTIALVASLSNVIAATLIPGLTISNPATRQSVLDRTIYAFVCFSLPLSILGICLSTNVVELLAGKQFDMASEPFALLSASLPLTYCTTVMLYAAMAAGELKGLFSRSLGVLAGNVTLNLILIPHFGASGAAISLIVSEAIGLLLVTAAVRRSLSYSVSWRRLWKPGLAGAGMAGAAIGMREAHLGVGISATATLAAAALAAYCLVLALTKGFPSEAFALIKRPGAGRSL
jgi:O-antigen/teichoic acid export membrane protein